MCPWLQKVSKTKLGKERKTSANNWISLIKIPTVWRLMLLWTGFIGFRIGTKWWALVNTVRELRATQNAGNFLTTVSFSRRTLLCRNMELMHVFSFECKIFTYLRPTGWNTGFRLLARPRVFPLHSRVDIAPPHPLGPTQSPIQWVQRTLPFDVKRPAREANHSLPSTAE